VTSIGVSGRSTGTRAHGCEMRWKHQIIFADGQRSICKAFSAIDELKAALAERGRWYLVHAYVHQASPAALRARETGMTAAPDRSPPPGPRDGDEDEDEDDSWKLYFDYLTPVPALEPVPPEDQRVMDEVISLVRHSMHLAAVQRALCTVASA